MCQLKLFEIDFSQQYFTVGLESDAFVPLVTRWGHLQNLLIWPPGSVTFFSYKFGHISKVNKT